MLPIVLSYIAFIRMRCVLSIPSSFRHLSQNDVEFYQRHFLLRLSCEFCPWLCLYAGSCLLISICWTIIASLEWVCKKFVEDFNVYVHQKNWSIIFFLYCVHPVFLNRPHRKSLVTFLPFLFNEILKMLN
jgi:hypothetical protein